MTNHPYGRFTQNGTAFEITKPDTPRAFDHFLWNNAVFSNVSQTGVGCFDYQIGELEAIQLLTGNGRVCDFDVYGRESLMSRLIYIRDNDSGEFWNVNWEPVCKVYEQYTCTHGTGYTTIHNVTDGIEAMFTILVPPGDDPVELWRLTVINRAAIRRRLSVFVYNQFQLRYKWGFDSYGDMLYRSGYFSEELNAVVGSKHPHVRPHDYLMGFLTADTPILRYDASRDAFVGIYGNLAAPKAVVEGQLGNTPGSSDATIGAVQLAAELDPNEESSTHFILGAADRHAMIARLKDKYLLHFNEIFKNTVAEAEKITQTHQIATPDQYFNTMFNYWMKRQSAFGARWCRWGWMGYRDIVQHGYGVCSFMPERTRQILKEALSRQFADGLAPRGWNPIDLKPYSDSALWLAFTLEAYVRETGDTAFLAEEIPFGDEGSATALAHVERALNFLENHTGTHGLCLIKFGDWNDSLTAVGKQGRGESVWLSEAYIEALKRMSSLYAFLGDQERHTDALARAERMTAAVKRAWDGEWFLRCYDDDGGKIGSADNDEGQIFCEAQAWALISGAGADTAEQVIRACDDKLLTPQGYKLLAPTFTKVNEKIGRISTLEPGICENGTIYSHVNIWMILGLLRNGHAEKAYDIFKRVSPGYLSNDDHKDRCPPYVYANCYYGPDHKNNAWQMEFTWVTGSIAWLNNVLAEEMLGVAANYNGLAVHPHLPSAWQEVTYTRLYRGAAYHFHICNRQQLENGTPRVTVDGTLIEGHVIPFFTDGGTHQIEVEMV